MTTLEGPYRINPASLQGRLGLPGGAQENDSSLPDWREGYKARRAGKKLESPSKALAAHSRAWLYGYIYADDTELLKARNR